MIKKIKVACRLLKYAPNNKMTYVFAGILFLIGFLIECLSHGILVMGGYFMLILPLFVMESLYGLGISDEINTSQYRKELQTKIPAMMNFIMGVVFMTVLLVIKFIECRIYPNDRDVIMSIFLYLVLFQLIFSIYTALIYKMYWPSMLVFIFICVIVFQSMNGWQSVIASELTNVEIIFLNYVCLIIGSILQYVISLLVYKKPLSKRIEANYKKKM